MFGRKRQSENDREWELVRREREADRMLYEACPSLAIELGYEPPVVELGHVEIRRFDGPFLHQLSLQAMQAPNPSMAFAQMMQQAQMQQAQRSQGLLGGLGGIPNMGLGNILGGRHYG